MRPIFAIGILGLSLGLCAADPKPAASDGALTASSENHLNLEGEALSARCSKTAFLLAEGRMGMVEALAPCTVALDTEALSKHQRAGTYVNRGVIYLTAGVPDLAEQDFQKAVGVEPELGEAYVNRGISEMHMDQVHEALADLDHGLTFKLEEPWKAYYNRGIALERLGDITGAYHSYQKASELKPDWADPKRELTRFKVQPTKP